VARASRCVTNAIKMTWWRPVQDFTSAATTPDLPQEWGLALIWNLAKEMGPEFDVTPNRWAMIKEMAAGHLDNVPVGTVNRNRICLGRITSQTVIIPFAVELL
jgi:hypothetical protein